MKSFKTYLIVLIACCLWFQISGCINEKGAQFGVLPIDLPKSPDWYRLGVAHIPPQSLIKATLTNDGSRVVFMSDLDTTGMIELYVADLNGHSFIKISQEPIALGDVSNFTISNDSTQVLYTQDTRVDGQEELYLVNINGDNPQRISPETLNFSMTVLTGDGQFAFCTNGDRVAYIGNVIDPNANELFVRNKNLTGHLKVSGTMIAGGNVQAFQISPNCNTLVFLADKDIDGVNELYSVTNAGINLSKLHFDFSLTADVTTFSATPDFTRIIFIADQDTDGIFDIYSDLISGGAQVKYVSMPATGDVTTFALSADSTTVAYLADPDVDGANELFVATTAGTGVTKAHAAYVAGRSVTNFSFTPDSSRVVYIADQDVDNDFEVYSSTKLGAGNVQVSGAMVAFGDATSFVVQPNSLKVGYVADANVNGTFEVFIADILGVAPLINLPLSAANVIPPTINFTPDSTKIFSISDKDVAGVGEVYLYTTDGLLGPHQLNEQTGVGDITGCQFNATSEYIFCLGDIFNPGSFEPFASSVNGLP